MSSFVASRFAASCAALGLLLFAGSARAQFAECVDPTDVPEAVFETILSQAGFDFGSVSAKVCKGIVNKGVSTCKAQVKLSEKCFRRAYDTDYTISVKQCQQLSKQDRSDCKSEAKSIRDEGKDDIKNSGKFAIGICEGEFDSALTDACENGIVM